MFSAMMSFAEHDSAAGAVGVMIGLFFGMFIMFFKVGFDLFFITSKDLMPNFFGAVLFVHENMTKSTVINSTKDDQMNFGEYHWF